MARTVDYNLKGEKIKQMIDDILQELAETKKMISPASSKPKISDIDWDEVDIKTLQQLQVRIARLILEKSK